MKTIHAIVVLSIGMLSVSRLYAQPVHFEDPNLKGAVETRLGLTEPNSEDMLRLEVLTADNLGITDLTGLEYALNLTRLRLYNNDIADISPLQNLAKIKYLVLGSNDIVDVSPLGGMLQLTELHVSGNRIHDISSLVTLTSLERLNLAWNDNITDIGVITAWPNLYYIYFDGSPIGDYETNLDILSELTHLQDLGIANCDIPNLNFLSELHNLKYLALFNNSLTDISTLANLTELETLRLNINGITDVTALLDLHHLLSLEIQDNSLSQEAYCEQIPQIIRNNPDMILEIDANPYFPYYPGDLPGTGCGVDMEDLILLISFWLDELPPNQSEYDLAPEIGDGRIDFQDFAVLAQDWLKQM